MNTDNFLIAEDDLKNAQELCKNINDATIRGRAVANVLSANIASKMFDDSVTVDIESGLHNIQTVLQDIDIADIYVNGSYIDVRFYFIENGICVPKIHYDENILPIAYMFIKIEEDLSSSKLSGFILPKNVQTISDVKGYYKVDENDLVSFYDIENYLGTEQEEEDVSDEELYRYADGVIENKGEFYSKIIHSRDARRRLAKICNASRVFNNASIDISNIAVEDNNSDFDDLMNMTNDMYTNTDANDIESENEVAYSTVTTPSLNEEGFSQEEQGNSEQLEVLFNSDEQEPEANEIVDDKDAELTGTPEEEVDAEDMDENSDDSVVPEIPKKKTSPLVFVLLSVILAGAGYYGYNTYMQSSINEELPDASATETPQQEAVKQNGTENAQEAMPIETVENVEKTNNKNEAVSVEIPAIENNLDTSILVSNLKVDWEVPSGYASNTSARRYLVKLGKVIQLNLKTELLLLNRPPITNRIAVEIRYNNASKKFETVGIVTSSGEKVIDDIITQTVSKALSMNISVNTDSFDKLQGNPILIIKL